MKERWKKFLLDAGAEMDNGRVLHFGNPERELRVATTGNVLSDLNHLGLISAHGADAATFLQGQLTCDIRDVTDDSSLLGASCSHKGRVLTLFRLFRRGDGYYLQCAAELVEETLKRLRKYVLMSKVTLEDAGSAMVRFGYLGPEADRHLSELLGKAPEEVGSVIQTPDLLVVRLPGTQPRFEIAGSLEPACKLWESLNAWAAPVGAEAWRLQSILAGVPEVYAATSELFVPQMLNLQVLQGISFIKGCYTGQEVVARSEYLGKQKRRMFRAFAPAADRPEPGTDLYAPGSQSGQGPGKVVDAALAQGGGYEMLVVAELAAVEAGGMRLGDAEGPELEFRELPYALPEKA